MEERKQKKIGTIDSEVIHVEELREAEGCWRILCIFFSYPSLDHWALYLLRL